VDLCFLNPVLCAFDIETFSFLTTIPENAAVINGTTVVMKCRTNDTREKIFWRAPTNEILPKKISNGERISREWSRICYVNNSLSGQHDLIINTTMSAGTQYVCQEGPYANSSLAGIAELVVLGKYIIYIVISR